MEILFNKKFLDYNENSNFEGAYRIKSFANKYPDAETELDPVPYILNVHSEKYLNKIKELCENKNELVGIKLNMKCFESALLAVSLTIKASETGNFAVVRPPGHHADREKASGFCLFNNIVIATKKLLSEGKRVAILDIDGHHGDGTQNLLDGVDNVFFCSLHELGVFPGTGFDSKDNYANFPLKPPISEKAYLEAFDKAVQKLKDFDPDVLGVSIGLDTYHKDKLLDFNLSIETYKHIGYKLKSNFKNIFAVLEGGYHNDVMLCIESFVSGINS